MPNLDTRTTKTPAVDDYTYLLSNDGTVEGKVELQNVTVIPETTRTINFTSSQTASQINAEIETVGRYIPKDVTITFQFANGTYTLNDVLLFNGFYGGGKINVLGNTNETNNDSLHTTQDVELDFTGSGKDGLSFGFCDVQIHILNLKISADESVDGVYLVSCSNDNRFWYGFIDMASTASGGYGLKANMASSIYVRETYFSKGQFGIGADVNSRVYSVENDDTGTQPSYGLRALAGGVIAKNSTQPSGSAGNESVANGGEIR